MFDISSPFVPTGDQPQAIEKLAEGVLYGLKNQVLLGVTGSGKTFTMAQVIKKLQMPALVISHNKTLAGQLYQEMRDFFPTSAVSYFVSYYDYYQPEAYIPSSDTYIEKEAQINDLIDKLRLASTTNILTRPDAIVVASVSCIYNIGSPVEYGNFVLDLTLGDAADWTKISHRMVELLYDRSEFEFKRGTFRIRGNYMDIYPAYGDNGIRIEEVGGRIVSFTYFDPLTGKPDARQKDVQKIMIYPAKHYLMDRQAFIDAEAQIRSDLKSEVEALKKRGRLVEAQRLSQKVTYDLEMIKEVGYVNGIENYSRYFDGRKPGDPPYSLLDYFKKAYGDKFIVIIDESHMTIPQVRGMYNGDHSRKSTLIDFGFRMRAALDNRPMKFEEFYKIPSHIVYVSATPDAWEMDLAHAEAEKKKYKGHQGIVEQLVRPTGIVDPEIVIRPAKGEIEDLIREIEMRVANHEKILVTTLTKKTAEDLSEFLKEKAVRASYLHSDVHTLERSDILDNLRKNEFDVLIGVNLLREGLDLPEVTLVAILDADREGFLRSRTSLIQTMGRAARNTNGSVILYADVMTKSIIAATDEIKRRREYQLAYNKEHGITAVNIIKPVRERIAEGQDEYMMVDRKSSTYNKAGLAEIKTDSLTPYDKKRMIKKLTSEMKTQADEMNFELAIEIRDKIRELKS